MAEADKSLKVAIEATSNVPGVAKQSAESLDNLQQETGKVADKMSDGAAATAKAEARFEGATGRSRELYRIFYEMDRFLPGFGETLRGVFLGPLGAMGAVLAIGYEIKKQVDDYNKALDEEGKEAAAGHEAAIQNLLTTWDDVRTSQAKYMAQLADAGKDKDPIATQVKRIKEIEAAQLESNIKIIESLGKVEEARIRANGGTEADVDAARRRTQSSVDAARDAAGQQSVADMQIEFSRRQLEQPSLEAQEDAATQAAGMSAQKLGQAMARRDQLGKPDEILAKKIEAALAQLEKANTAMTFGQSQVASGNGVGIDLEQLQKEADIKQKNLDALNQQNADRRREHDQLEKSMPLLEQENAMRQKQLEDAREAANTNKNRLGELPGEIGQAQKIQDIKRAGRAEADSIPQAASDFQQAQTIAQLIAHGEKISQAQQTTLQAVANAMGIHAKNAQDMANSVLRMASNQVWMEAAIMRIEAVMSRLGNHTLTQG